MSYYIYVMVKEKINEESVPVLMDKQTLPSNCLYGYATTPVTTGSFNPTGSTICCELNKVCDVVQFFPRSKVLLLSNANMSKFADSVEPMKSIIHDLVESVANKFDLPNDQVRKKFLSFSKEKRLESNLEVFQG